MATSSKPGAKPGKAVAPPAKAGSGKALAKSGATSLSTAVTNSTLTRMLEDAKQGNNFAKDDLTIPFLRVLQALSPQVQKRGEQYVDGAEVGMLFDTASKALFPAEKAEDQPGVVFVPAWYTPSYVEFVLRESGGGFVRDHGTNAGILARTTRDDKNREILPNGNQVVYSMMYYGFICFEEDGELNGEFTAVALPLAGKQLKKGREWNTYMDKLRVEYQGATFNPPHYYTAFRLTTAYESNDKGNWYGINWEPIGPTHDLPNGEAILNQASQFRESLSKGAVRAKMDEVVEAEITDDEEGRADGGKKF